MNSAKTIIAGWKKGLKHLDKFWQIWRNDNLLSLRGRTQTKLKPPRVQTPTAAKVDFIGHIVLIKDNLPRGYWRIGRITEMIRRISRFAQQRYFYHQIKIIGRPLNLLYLLNVQIKKRWTMNISGKTCQLLIEVEYVNLEDKQL